MDYYVVAMKICLSEFLSGLDFLKARKSGEFVGTREDNPAMILEEQVAAWTRLTSLEDLQVKMIKIITSYLIIYLNVFAKLFNS
jgi:hypothetical protein